MPRKCTVCQHPKRKGIERAFVAGGTYRDIAARFDLTPSSLVRHVTHVARRLWRARRLVEFAKAQDMGDLIGETLVSTRELLATAKRTKDLKAWAAAVQAMTRLAELIGRLEGRLKEAQVVFILDSPAWKQVEDRMFAALEEHPKARDSVARELLRLSGGT